MIGQNGLSTPLLALAVSLSASAAEALPCQRPTDPGGVNGYAYGADAVSSFDGASVRVFYALTGPHAVNPATTRADMVPDNVATAAGVADAALASYAKMGFLPPISDSGSGTSCGGSPALDIYLMHFNAADGDTATEGCKAVGKAETCSSFGQVEARLEDIYGTFELGAHVVIAHELFHSVQDAYDTKLDRFWAEGTAQWGAKTIDPAEMDLESFLPSFFNEATQSIDLGGGSVVADFLYGSAIWPVFLTEHVDPNVVRGALEQEAKLGPPSMTSIGAALPAFNSSLEEAYPTFAAWNAATGSRAGTGGYASAKTYPMVKLEPFANSSATGIVTGYSVFYFSYDFGSAEQDVTLTGDATRVAARAFPLVNGKAALDKIAPLPATLSGAGVMIVAGISPKKTDAPFTLDAVPTPMPTPMPTTMPTMTPPMTPPATPAAPGSSGGCGIGEGNAAGAWLFALVLGIAARTRKRRVAPTL